MLAYIAKRLLLTLPTLLLVSVGVFLFIRLIPGDPALVMLGDGADAASLAGLRADLGLTPVVVRYNTGRHICDNGDDLAALLDAVVMAWPVPV